MNNTYDFRYLKHLAGQGKGFLHPHGKAATEYLIEALKIENGNKVLEIGCGTGETIVWILSTHNVTVDGIDILPEMIYKAQARISSSGLKNRGKVFEYLQNGVLPFVNDSYDRIYAESVLGFQDEASAKNLLKEAYRVLKKGGLLAANDMIWKEDTSFQDIEKIYNSSIEDFGLAPSSQQPWTVNEWLKVYKETGFEVLSFDLISELLRSGKNETKKSFRKYYSGALSKYFYLKSMLKPSVRLEASHFKKLLKKHRDDGKYLESRLFILRKN